MPKLNSTNTTCPCGGLPAGSPYETCCGVWHTSQHPLYEASPEQIMRSRYSAYVLHDLAYLQNTWSTDTCPADLSFAAPQPKWLGLQVLASRTLNSHNAEVEFIARYKEGGRAFKLHELSQFYRSSVQDVWRYVSGEHS